MTTPQQQMIVLPAPLYQAMVSALTEQYNRTAHLLAQLQQHARVAQEHVPGSKSEVPPASGPEAKKPATKRK